MIPTLDMSKVHEERVKASCEDQLATRTMTAPVTATTTSNNTTYTSVGGTVTTPGRTLPLRNQPNGASSQLQQSTRPSSSTVTPQTSPRGQLSSERLTRRAQEVEPYLHMNPLACSDVRVLQRLLIATAEAAMRLKYQYEEESRLRGDLFEHRLAAVTALLTQSPSTSLAPSPTHRSNNNNNNNNNSLNTSMDKGMSSALASSTRSGRRYPATTATQGPASPNRGTSSRSPAPSSTPNPHENSSTTFGTSSANSGTIAPAPNTMAEKPSMGTTSARRGSRHEPQRIPAIGFAATTGGTASGLNTVGSATGSYDGSGHTASTRPRLDATSYQESPLRARESGRRGSLPTYAVGSSAMTYHDLGEGLGFSSRAGASGDRSSPPAHVQRGLYGGRSAAMSSSRHEASSGNSGRRGVGSGSHSARAPKAA